MADLFKEYGFWALLIFVIIDKGVPLVKEWLPFADKKNERRMALENEELERTHDLEERQVVAMEIIGKNLVLLSEQLRQFERGQNEMMEGLRRANEGLEILLDRRTRQRKSGQNV